MIGLDDRILEHPKFLVLLSEAGGDGLLLWLAMRAHCGQHLTDGRVPKSLVPHLRGPRGKRAREACLETLLRVGLLHDAGDDWLMHDYLDWADSREKVLAKRERWRTRQGLKRLSNRDTNEESAQVSRRDNPESPPEVTEVSRCSSSSSSSSSRSDPKAYVRPKDLSGQGAGDAPPDTHTGLEPAEPEQRKPPAHLVNCDRSFWPTVDTWAGPTPEHQRYAREHGLTLDFERVKYESNRKKNAFRCASFDADFQEWLAGSAERLRARRKANGESPPTLSEDRITASQARILAKIRRESHG